MYNEKTITAIITPLEQSSVGIIRISGPKSVEITKKIIKKKIIKNINITNIFLKNKVIDFGIVLYFKKPKSYTGEDVVEIQSHGNLFILKKLISEIIKLGAYLSKPGEFTYRAFINNKIDLSQAESVTDIINAKNEKYLIAATNSYKGELSKK